MKPISYTLYICTFLFGVITLVIFFGALYGRDWLILLALIAPVATAYCGHKLMCIETEKVPASQDEPSLSSCDNLQEELKVTPIVQEVVCPDPVKIVIAGNWYGGHVHAHLDNDPNIWACGSSVAEVIGKLITENRKLFYPWIMEIGGGELKAPEEWEKDFSFKVLGPEGWVLANFPWEHPISRKQFEAFMRRSTVQPLVSEGAE